MASVIETCDLCLTRHITKEAENFCPQCDEKLCLDCTEHHRVSKASKTHQILSIDEYQQLPSFIRQIKQYCDEHGDIFDFYCRSHDDVCCKRCVTSTHKHCKDVEVIEDLIKTQSSSTALDEFDKTLQDVESNIDIVKADKKNNLSQLKNEKMSILQLVKEKKKEIVSHLDELEKKIQQNLTNSEGENRQQIGSLIQELEAKRSEANIIRRDIEMMKKHASNVQIFLGTRHLDEPVFKLKKYLLSICGNEGPKRISIECKFNNQLFNLTKDIKEFGTLSQKYKETSCTLSWQEERAAQLFASKQKTIDNIKLESKLQIDVEGYVNGCTVTKNADLLFTTAYHGLIVKYNCKGQLVSKVQLNDTCTFDIVPIDADTVVVTCGARGHVLYILDTDQLRIKKTIDTGEWSYGATYHGGFIMACTSPFGMSKISLSATKYTPIMQTSNTRETFITSDNNHLYHSNKHTNSVDCYDFHCNKKWTYKGEIVNGPRCITIDSYSNLYVVGYDSNTVVVISRDGKKAKQLLGPDDGLVNPHAIFLDKDRKNLIVANFKGPAFVYAVL